MMSPEERRHHAVELILDGARNGESLSIRAHLELAGVEGFTPADCRAINQLIRTAEITVGWPDAQAGE